MPESPLKDALEDRIQRSGPIPFADYMDAALYHPEHGYYATANFTTGRQGDFATAPDTGPLLGATLANPIERFAEQPGKLVELGPGAGRLIQDITTNLSAQAQTHLDLVLVEPFPARHDALSETFEDSPFTPEIIQDAASLEPDRTFLLANEVLDALPCEVLQQTSHGLERLHVDTTPQGFTETWQPAPPDLEEHLHPLQEGLPPEHRYEYAPDLRDFLASLRAALQPGLALLLDYGGRYKDLWPQRPKGTLRAFREHRHVDPLTQPGQTDITYDVDFDRVHHLAHDVGLEPQAFGAQERLLVHLGLMEIATQENAFLQAKQLLVPGAFAGRFHALVLGDQALATECELDVDLDDPSLWDRGLPQPLGTRKGDLAAQVNQELQHAWDPPKDRDDS